jgi:predicted nucleic acid-binding protein
MVIDTDILIDHFHGNASATNFIQDALLSGETLLISVATVAEILAGMRPGEEERTEALLSLFTAYPADEALARVAGVYLNQYPAGKRLDLGDALIAATAKVSNSTLYTRNVRHYPMTDIPVRVPYERGRA